VSEEALRKLYGKACERQDDEGFEKTFWVYGRDCDEETPHFYLIGSRLVSSGLAVPNKNAFEAVGKSSRKLPGLGSEALMLEVHGPGLS
jgi:hypothetical protein